MASWLERSENEPLRPLRACFSAVILTIAKSRKSRVTPAPPRRTVCVHFQTEPRTTQLAGTAKNRCPESSGISFPHLTSVSNYRIRILLFVLRILDFGLLFSAYGFQNLVIGILNSGFRSPNCNSNSHILHLSRATTSQGLFPSGHFDDCQNQKISGDCRPA